MTTTILGGQVAATKDIEAYAKENSKSPVSTVCKKRKSRKGGGRYSISEGRRIKAERDRRRRVGVKPNRFYTKPFKTQKVHKTAKALVKEAFEKAGINEVCIPDKGYNEWSVARNDFAQEIAKLERVVRHYESRLRRMRLSPNEQGRKEIVRETMSYYDTKIAPRIRRLRSEEIKADTVHKKWSYMWDTGNYSRLYDLYISPEKVSEMYLKYLRERLRITTELRIRVKGSNTIPYGVLYAYKGSINNVHLLYQQYRTGEFVLAASKYEHHKDAYGANTLMSISKMLLKPSSTLPIVNYRDNDQVPQAQATMSVNLIFGGRESRESRKLEQKMKKELQVEYRKNVAKVIAMIAEDSMARLQKQGYHLHNNRYFVLSAVFEFLIFDVGVLDDVTKARLATKADDLKKLQGIKKGTSVADDVARSRSTRRASKPKKTRSRSSSAVDDLDNGRNRRSRRRRTNNVPCTTASAGLSIIAGLNSNGEVVIASSTLANHSGYSEMVSDVGGILIAKKCVKAGWSTDFKEKFKDHPHFSKLPLEDAKGGFKYEPPALKNGKIDWQQIKNNMKNGGVVDSKGRIWKVDKTSIQDGQNNFHFDVQLKNGNHTNVNPDGTINH